MPVASVCAVSSYSSSAVGWSSTLGDRFIQGKWSDRAQTDSIPWKELWTLGRAEDTWGGVAKDKLILAWMAAYANFGAGCSPGLTTVARRKKCPR